MSETEAWQRLRDVRVGSLATVDTDGRPHLVPFVFAVDDTRIVSAVDQKPKRSPDLQRLRNIRANPFVSVLVDHYEDDWARLWWVRADGRARVSSGNLQVIAALTAKYPQYEELQFAGPAILIDIERVTGWTAEG